MEFKIPGSLKVEHEELHAELVQATKVEGPVGEAARNVATLLHPHFVKEEEYALSPLGLLGPLATGAVTPAMREVLAMTDRLKAELPEMLAEHRAVVGALQKLIAAAKREDRSEVVRFAEKLMLHAQTEEEVLYPTAILIGEYVRRSA
jgi:hypothetical protein